MPKHTKLEEALYCINIFYTSFFSINVWVGVEQSFVFIFNLPLYGEVIQIVLNALSCKVENLSINNVHCMTFNADDDAKFSNSKDSFCNSLVGCPCCMEPLCKCSQYFVRKLKFFLFFQIIEKRVKSLVFVGK